VKEKVFSPIFGFGNQLFSPITTTRSDPDDFRGN